MPALTTVNIGPAATLLYGSQGSQSSPLTIINTDPTNTIWVGNASNIMVAATNTIPLAPGDSFTSDGSVSLYGVTNGPTVAVAITPGGNSYSPGTLAISGPVTATISGPVTVEGTVGISGTVDADVTGTVNIGTIAGSVDIASVAGNVDITPTAGYIPAGLQSQITAFATGLNIAAGGSISSSIEPCSAYNSYYLSASIFTTSQATAGAAYSCQVQIEWYIDAAGTMPVALETFWIWSVNNTSAALPAFISGPMQGSYMSITLSNPGTSETQVTGVVNLFGSGATLVSTRAYQAAPATGQLGGPTSPHFVLAGASSGTDGILTSLIDETAFAASTLYWLPCPLQVGPVDTFCITNGTAMTTQPTLMYLKGLLSGGISAPSGNNGQIAWTPSGNTVGTTYNGNQIFQPRSPLFWILQPGATAPTSVTITMLTSPT